MNSKVEVKRVSRVKQSKKVQPVNAFYGCGSTCPNPCSKGQFNSAIFQGEIVKFHPNYDRLINNKQMKKNAYNIQYAIIAGFCGRLKNCARKKHLCNFDTIVP